MVTNKINITATTVVAVMQEVVQVGMVATMGMRITVALVMTTLAMITRMMTQTMAQTIFSTTLSKLTVHIIVVMMM